MGSGPLQGPASDGQDHVSRALLCTFSFPPLGDPTSFRWYQFAKHQDSSKWNLDILTINVGLGYPGYDPRPLTRLPNSIRVFRTWPGPYAALKGRPGLSLKADAKVSPANAKAKRSPLDTLKPRCRTVAIPDRMVEWVPFALTRAKWLTNHVKYDLVISSSFPFSSHIVGYFASKWAKKPWIGDISDPYAFMPENDFPRWRKRIDQTIESRMLSAMDIVVVPTKEIEQAYLAFYPTLLPKRIRVVPYGFDEELINGIDPEGSPGFRLVYTGIFYNKIRNPYPFFDAMKQVEDLPVELVIAGEVQPEYVEFIHRTGLTKNVCLLGPQPRERAISLQKGATVLLLLGNKGGLQLPGKVFEYIAANRPILHVRNESHDIAANLVDDLGRGVIVDNNPTLIASAIRSLYRSWCEGTLETMIRMNSGAGFGWRSQASKMTTIMDEAIEKA